MCCVYLQHTRIYFEVAKFVSNGFVYQTDVWVRFNLQNTHDDKTLSVDERTFSM